MRVKLFKPYNFKNGEMPCFICHNEPVIIKSRKLGRRCYTKLRSGKGLPPKPDKSSFERKMTFLENLYEKYGDEIINDFRLLNSKLFWNLTDISNKYGFTREYSRQIYKMLFGQGYRDIQKKKTERIKKEIDYCRNDPRYKVAEYKPKSNHEKAAKSELLFYDKCNELGYKIDLLCNNSIDIKINGYLVDVKSCYFLKRVSKSGPAYARFNVSDYQRKNADIIACYHASRNSFFIIPINIFPKGNTAYIPEKPSNHSNAKNKYEQYQEAWHLLEPKH